MGKKNNAICSYLEKPEKFADFVNGSLYNGRQILHPEQLTERQTIYSKVSISHDEFLSGIKREDRLNPVITIVFYHGKDIYDGCTNLHDMLNFGQENENFKQFVPNYHINLVTLADLDERNFQTGVRELIGFLKHSTSKAELQKYCADNRRGDNMNMCQAIIEWEEELLQKGKEQGIEALILDYMEEGFSDTRIKEKLQKRFHLDASSAENYFLKYSDLS